jgi:hypothetical protein
MNTQRFASQTAAVEANPGITAGAFVVLPVMFGPATGFVQPCWPHNLYALALQLALAANQPSMLQRHLVPSVN